MNRYFIFLSFLLVFNACEKNFLEEDPKSFLGPDNALLNAQGFETAIAGLHSITRDEWGLVYGGFTDGMFFAGTDLCFARGHANYTAYQDYGDFLNSFDGSASGMWVWAYTLIANCNQIIIRADNPDIVWTDAIKKTTVVGEARFFRAYAYRTLIYLFGDVPIVEQVEKPFRTNFTRNPKADVLKFIIADLVYAGDNLPVTSTQKGRIAKAAAQHYLGEMYILNGQADLAKIELLKIISSGTYQLMSARFGTKSSSPGDCFSDLFVENNQNHAANKETIWAQQFQYNVPGGDANEWQRRAWLPAYYNNAGMVISEEYGGRGVGLLEPLDWIMNAYDASDIRGSQYNIIRNWIYNSPTHPNYLKPAIITDQLKAEGKLYVTTRKFNFYQAASPTFAHMQKDRYRIRLAETYLLLAEAELKLNNKAGAANYINIVRARANATPVLEANVTLDYYLDERARELFGEYPRRYELVRTGTLLARTRALNPYSSATIKDRNLLCPIPQSVIDANTGANFPQNPGY